MLNKITFSNENYHLIYIPNNKIVNLLDKRTGHQLLKATFFHDTSDGASLLSNFCYNADSKQSNDLVCVMTDLVSEYLSHTQDKCKLFCHPGIYSSELMNNPEYKSTNLDRLMLRENKKYYNKTVVSPKDITYGILKTYNDEDLSSILILLKQTYWAEGADRNYVKKAIRNSVFYIARDHNQIIGFVRCISNNHFAYISDMVVDEKWRRQNIATLLMQQLCQNEEVNHDFIALISAREGEGKDAAQKLYGEKFGFLNYDVSHQHTVYFRYIRMLITPVIQTKIISQGEKPIVQHKWQISKIAIEKPAYSDPSWEKLTNDFGIQYGMQKKQHFINENAIKGIIQFSLIEAVIENLTEPKLRLIYVQFGKIFPLTMLNTILEKRKLSLLSQNEFESGCNFVAKNYNDLIETFSTLHEISRMSKEVKDNIVEFLGDGLTVDQKISLRKSNYSPLAMN